MTTTLSPEERADLKAKAEGSLVNSDAPWSIGETQFGDLRVNDALGDRVCDALLSEDAEYIAAANPSVILSLLTALEEAEGRLDEHALFDAETDLAFKDLDATIADLTARAEKAEAALYWALGEDLEDEFASRGHGESALWWRYELRRRCGLPVRISPSKSEADSNG